MTPPVPAGSWTGWSRSDRAWRQFGCGGKPWGGSLARDTAHPENFNEQEKTLSYQIPLQDFTLLAATKNIINTTHVHCIWSSKFLIISLQYCAYMYRIPFLDSKLGYLAPGESLWCSQGWHDHTTHKNSIVHMTHYMYMYMYSRCYSILNIHDSYWFSCTIWLLLYASALHR